MRFSNLVAAFTDSGRGYKEQPKELVSDIIDRIAAEESQKLELLRQIGLWLSENGFNSEAIIRQSHSVELSYTGEGKWMIRHDDEMSRHLGEALHLKSIAGMSYLPYLSYMEIARCLVDFAKKHNLLVPPIDIELGND